MPIVARILASAQPVPCSLGASPNLSVAPGLTPHWLRGAWTLDADATRANFGSRLAIPGSPAETLTFPAFSKLVIGTRHWSYQARDTTPDEEPVHKPPSPIPPFVRWR